MGLIAAHGNELGTVLNILKKHMLEEDVLKWMEKDEILEKLTGAEKNLPKEVYGLKKYATKVVQKKGKRLEECSEKLKDDKEFVLIAIKQDEDAYEHASKRLKQDQEVMKAAGRKGKKKDDPIKAAAKDGKKQQKKKNDQCCSTM
jgi:hypothetical protein